MEQTMAFFMSHWVLSLLFLLALIAVLLYEFREKATGPKRLDPQHVIQLINHEEAIIVDLRSSEEFKRGHIVHALNFSDFSVERDLKKLESYKQRPVIVVCKNGQLAARIADQLKKKGFEQAKILMGGMKTWQDASMPVEKK